MFLEWRNEWVNEWTAGAIPAIIEAAGQVSLFSNLEDWFWDSTSDNPLQRALEDEWRFKLNQKKYNLVVDKNSILLISSASTENHSWAKFSNPLLWLFYKSSKGLWSILVVRRLNKCNSIISFFMESELRAIHPVC